jgi:hypothetical protein
VTEKFDFRAVAHLPKGSRAEVHVIVDGHAVVLYNSTGIIASGRWDAGKYVRYPKSQSLQVPPQLLDEIDRELRLRMTIKGLQERVDPPRRSAIGYGDH